MTSLALALKKLRDAGYKITNARKVVLSVLCASDSHLTSAEILERVDAQDATIGRASVFRTLELLTSLAIVRPTYLESRTPVYVLLPADGHHAHIVCTRCNRVIELENCHVGELVDEFESRYRLRMMGHLLEFYAICSNCESTPLDEAEE